MKVNITASPKPLAYKELTAVSYIDGSHNNTLKENVGKAALKLVIFNSSAVSILGSWYQFPV